MSIQQRIDNLDYKKPDIVDSLSWDRLDLAFELLYLDLINKNKELAKRIYMEEIRARKEINNHKKSMKCNKEKKYDYKFYQRRGVDEKILQSVVKKFIEYASKTYMAFLWPAGKGHRDKVHSMFKNVVYKKDITLTPKGAFNLIYESYKPVDWLGDKTNNYKGTYEKVVKCFPDFSKFTIVVFQSESLKDVRKLKEAIRDIYNVNYNSIHTTDNREEAVRLSRLVLNENGRHFLNYSNPHRFELLKSNIDLIKSYILGENLNANDLILDGDMTLAAYGIKQPRDVKYLPVNNNRKELIYNPSNYFYYCGVKLLSLKKVWSMKANSILEKDKVDIEKINSLIENTPKDYKTTKLDQKLMYMKIKLKLKTINLIKDILKKIKLFEVAKKLHNKIIK